MAVSPNKETKSIDFNKLLAAQQCLWFKELKESSIDLEIDQKEFIWVHFLDQSEGLEEQFPSRFFRPDALFKKIICFFLF